VREAETEKAPQEQDIYGDDLFSVSVALLQEEDTCAVAPFFSSVAQKALLL
jgi:hypothetical protein